MPINMTLWMKWTYFLKEENYHSTVKKKWITYTSVYFSNKHSIVSPILKLKKKTLKYRE